MQVFGAVMRSFTTIPSRMVLTSTVMLCFFPRFPYTCNMGEGKRFYAHTPGERGVWHDLVLHLERTAALAQANATKFGAGQLANLAGIWHDIGKFNPDFQEYLRRCERAVREEAPAPAKSVPHAVYGAVLAWDSVN